MSYTHKDAEIDMQDAIARAIDGDDVEKLYKYANMYATGFLRRVLNEFHNIICHRLF